MGNDPVFPALRTRFAAIDKCSRWNWIETNSLESNRPSANWVLRQLCGVATPVRIQKAGFRRLINDKSMIDDDLA
jgi:hypothetical protein